MYNNNVFFNPPVNGIWDFVKLNERIKMGANLNLKPKEYKFLFHFDGVLGFWGFGVFD